MRTAGTSKLATNARRILRRLVTLLPVFVLACPECGRHPDEPPPVLTSATLTLSSTDVIEGETVTYALVVLDENGNQIDAEEIDGVILVSSNPAVASIQRPISSPDRVLAVSAGTTQITARITAFDQTFTSTPVTLNVRPKPVASVDVSSAVTSITEEGTATVTATPRDDQGNALAGRPAPTFSVNNPSFATIAPSATNPNQATLSGVAPGGVTVSATISGVVGQKNFSVTAAPVQTVTITLSSATIDVGQTATATATLRSAGGKSLTGTAQFATSNAAVATVAPSSTNGLLATVTAVSPGTASITATSANNVSASQTITVNAVPISSLDLDLPKSTIDVNEMITATVIAKDGQGNVVPTPPGVSYSSTNTAAATVNANTGVVTGVAVGQTDIRASLGSLQSFKTLQILSPTNFRLRWVATGAFTTYAIEDGTNFGYAAGRNNSGQAGVNFASPEIAGFTAMAGGLQWKQISAGIEHYVGLTVGGDVYAGGYNFNGQVGDGTSTNRSSPVRVNLPDKAWLVRAGGNNSCAVLNDGALFCWGTNQYGQLFAPAGGDERNPTYLTGNPATPVTSVAIGEGHIAYTRANVAGIWARGLNNHGQIGDGTTTNRSSFVWAVMPAQTGSDAVNFTMPSVSQASQAADNMRFPLSAGWQSTCFAPDPMNVAGGALNSSVLCTGNNQLRDVSDASTSPIVDPEWRPIPRIQLQFRDRPASRAFATAGVAGIMGGFTSNKVHTTDGRILGIGFGFFGNFGNGVFVNEPQWVVMAGGQRFAKVASSPVAYHTCAIDAAKALWCWGRNDYGQLGVGATSSRETTPRRISKP
jgi:hypothetical protein